jgi:hypothetical protein
MSKNIDIKHI